MATAADRVPDDAEGRAAMAERARDFIGRRWALARVDDWFEHGSQRFLLITGEPGSGKTALAAWLSRLGPEPDDPDAAAMLARVRAGWDAVHFCVARGQRGTVNPSRFARLLAEQLARRHDAFAEAVIDRIAPNINLRLEVRENWGTIVGAKLERLILVETDAEEIYNRAVREPLEELARARPDLSVRILVDALDEALTVEEPNIVTLLAGSADLPPMVRLVLTSRDEPRVLDMFDDEARFAALRLSGDEYADANDADLRGYVSRRLADAVSTRPGARAEAIENDLVAQADGNFLYASWVLNEMAAGRSPDNLVALPHGLYGLYRTFLDRLVPQARQEFSSAWLGRHEPFFGSLAVATPVAPESALPRWLGWSTAQLNTHVEDVAQVIEYLTDPVDGDSGYRLYHRSIAEFFTAKRYPENGGYRGNRYYVEPGRQHDRIATHYLRRIRDRDDWAGDWTRCDAYGLRQLVGHLRARLDSAEEGRRALARDLYEVALNPAFQAAQREQLPGVHATLSDLRLTLDAALAERGGRDLLPALRSAAAFRGITRGESLTRAVFAAVAAEDFALALQKTEHYGAGSRSEKTWGPLLKLYVAWEAAQAGEPQVSRQAVAAAGHVNFSATTDLADVLMTRAAAALAGDEVDVRDWLTEFGSADIDRLLMTYPRPAAVDPDVLAVMVADVEPRIRDLERLTAAGSAEAVSARGFIDEQAVPLMDPESSAEVAWHLREKLYRIAEHPAGQELVRRAVVIVLTNPYPRYRDIALAAIAVASLGSGDRWWVRQHLQSVLRAGLDDEGVTFTFDLPSMVLAEWERRGRSAPFLSGYLDTALGCTDVWGTSMRALGARSAVAYRLGRTADAFALLRQASAQPTTYAGYAVTGVLGLIDRCYEFGDPNRARRREWGPDADASLVDMAVDFARRVHDPNFRRERVGLVERHEAWSQQVPPEPGLLSNALPGGHDPDERMAYLGHVSARYAAQSDASAASVRLKALVPVALFDSTALDTVLGRLVAVLTDDLGEEMEDLVRLTSTEFTTGRPWKLGAWR
jgi:hypothetical protein